MSLERDNIRAVGFYAITVNSCTYMLYSDDNSIVNLLSCKQSSANTTVNKDVIYFGINYHVTQFDPMIQYIVQGRGRVTV